MSGEERFRRPFPSPQLVRALRRRHALSEPSARLVADLHFGGRRRG